MAWWYVGITAASSLYASSEANEAAARTQEQTQLRYGEQARVAQQQMLEQQDIAREKMTDVTLQFLAAKGKAVTVQAETGVAGKTAQRRLNILRGKASEAKSKIARDVDTNIMNIANDMLVKKIDADKIMADAEAQKKSSLAILAEAGLAGAKAYASVGGFNKKPESSGLNLPGSKPAKQSELPFLMSGWTKQVGIYDPMEAF